MELTIIKVGVHPKLNHNGFFLDGVLVGVQPHAPKLVLFNVKFWTDFKYFLMVLVSNYL